MNQEGKAILKELIDLVNDHLTLIKEIYAESEDETVRKEAVEHRTATLDSLSELQRVDKLMDQREMNDIEAARIKKLRKEYRKSLIDKKMNLEVFLNIAKQ